ncbi:YjeF-related protein N-terminus family protein [Candida albicans]|uniref:NAD(P)H-hydrate epimerase n=1 Tax=Candida albicans TaxID=5476 RepID=A0A8H6F4J9_CANAX|nr:YjeF-related protein N-terminus family protein [Candida albicans]
MSATAPFKTLSAKAAFQLDQELMSTGEFSIDQLMELAGLAVAKTIYKEYPPNEATTTTKTIAARHLKLWNYDPIIYYPKRPASNQLYSRLIKQLQDLNVPELTTLTEVKHLLDSRDSKIKIIIDSIFGFSFKPPIREPFKDLINYLGQNHDHLPPIVSVDIPSGWDVDEGQEPKLIFKHLV